MTGFSQVESFSVGINGPHDFPYVDISNNPTSKRNLYTAIKKRILSALNERYNNAPWIDEISLEDIPFDSRMVSATVAYMPHGEDSRRVQKIRLGGDFKLVGLPMSQWKDNFSKPFFKGIVEYGLEENKFSVTTPNWHSIYVPDPHLHFPNLTLANNYSMIGGDFNIDYIAKYFSFYAHQKCSSPSTIDRTISLRIPASNEKKNFYTWSDDVVTSIGVSGRKCFFGDCFLSTSINGNGVTVAAGGGFSFSTSGYGTSCHFTGNVGISSIN